jgi:hypothetical protein
MSRLAEMFQGTDGGKISGMRVASLGVVGCVMLIFLAQNIVSMCHNAGFVPLSWDMIALITAVLGVKAYQHQNDIKSNGNGNCGAPDVPDAPDVPETPPAATPAVTPK